MRGGARIAVAALALSLAAPAHAAGSYESLDAAPPSAVVPLFGTDAQLRATYERARSTDPVRALQAAHELMIRSAQRDAPDVDKWLVAVRDVWQLLAANGTLVDGQKAAVTRPYADWAAEAEYLLIDEEIRASVFGDDDGASLAFSGTFAQIVGAQDPKTGRFTQQGSFQTAAQAADVFVPHLKALAWKYASPEWGVAALARAAMIEDGLHDAIAAASFAQPTVASPPPLLGAPTNSLQQQAQQVFVTIKAVQENYRKRQVDRLAAASVPLYATAFVLAERTHVSNPTLRRAHARFAIKAPLDDELALRSTLRSAPSSFDEGDDLFREVERWCPGFFERAASCERTKGVAGP